jgi:DNA-binding transcriptional ArsR family regulator
VPTKSAQPQDELAQVVSFPALAPIGSLIGDPTRAAILTELLDGRALTAGELAARAEVTASTASSHLSKLVEGGLLAAISQGRHRYYRLASPQVAFALEALAWLAPLPIAARPFDRELLSALRFARTEYGHLAGRLAVALRDRLLEMNLIGVDGIEHYVAPAGNSWFARLGVDVEAARRAQQSFAPSCLDWSERRPHLAGALGDALLEALVDRGWIRRHAGERAVELTEAGERGLAVSLGLTSLRLDSDDTLDFATPKIS